MLALMNKGKTKEKPYFHDAKQLLQFYNASAVYHWILCACVCVCTAPVRWCNIIIYYYKRNNIYKALKIGILGGLLVQITTENSTTLPALPTSATTKTP